MKETLRKEMRQLIKNTLATPDFNKPGLRYPEEFLRTGIQTVFAFMSTDAEIDTSPLIEKALEYGKRVAVPRMRGKDLFFHQIFSSHGPFALGPFGIRESLAQSPLLFPVQGQSAGIRFPLLILIPGLAFTVRGDRLGKGKGYYDRFLQNLLNTYPSDRDLIILAGTAWEFQIVNSIETEKHDINVDCLYTEKRCIVCTNTSYGIPYHKEENKNG